MKFIYLEDFFTYIFFERQEWDNFLSSSSNARPVPIQWVAIDEPCNAEWAKFITLK